MWTAPSDTYPVHEGAAVLAALGAEGSSPTAPALINRDRTAGLGLGNDDGGGWTTGITTSSVSGCTARITAVGLATDRGEAALADGAVDRDVIVTQRGGAHEPPACHEVMARRVNTTQAELVDSVWLKPPDHKRVTMLKASPCTPRSKSGHRCEDHGDDQGNCENRAEKINGRTFRIQVEEVQRGRREVTK